MNQLLQTVTDSGTARSITLKNLVDTAGKTGTSGNSQDKIFVGYTPYYTAGIWCGNEGGKKSIQIGNLHLQIWDEIMKEVHSDILRGTDEPKGFSTEGLKYMAYCMDSGLCPTSACELDQRMSRIEYGYFTEDNCPAFSCNRHIICYLNEDGTVSLTENDNSLIISRVKYKREIPDGFLILDNNCLLLPEDVQISKGVESEKSTGILSRIFKFLKLR
jgi:penicillin-binding protein 1A